MIVFANNTSGTVTSGGTTAPASGSTESWTVSTTTFPAALDSNYFFHVADTVLSSEKIKVTSITGTSPYTWSVVRGDEGTSPVIHASNFIVQQVVTAADFGNFTPTFNVRAFGAVGDGATDDTTAIQAALNAVPSSVGGQVYFPPGNYFVRTAGLVPVANTTIHGIGRVASFGSQITLSSTATSPLFACSGVQGLEFHGLNLQAQNKWGGTAIDASSGGANYMVVRDNFFQGFYRSINFSSTATTTFQIWLFDNYINAVTNSAGAAGIVLQSVQSPTVIQNFIQGNGLTDSLNYGIHTTAGGGSSQYGVIIGNNIGQIGGGIYITDTGISDTTIQANEITGCGLQGMYIHNMTGCVIIGNTVGDVSLSSNNGFAAYELTYGHGTSTIIGNIYSNELGKPNNPSYGFILNGTVPVTFKANRVNGTTATGQLQIQGGSSLIQASPNTLTVTASPFTYTNNSEVDETVWVVGGTVSSVNFKRNGTSTAIPVSGPVGLIPGDGVTVTYSSAPTMTVVLA